MAPMDGTRRRIETTQEDRGHQAFGLFFGLYVFAGSIKRNIS